MTAALVALMFDFYLRNMTSPLTCGILWLWLSLC
jgi:hypothetical protein